LIFTTTGDRIIGDMSNATLANRLMFQTSTANSNSILSVIPSGTATTTAFQAFNNSDPTNASQADFRVSGSSDVRVSSTSAGSGTYLPMTFYTGGSERMRIDTSGNVGIGTSSPTNRLGVVGGIQVTQGALAFPTTGTGIEIVGGANGGENYVQAYNRTGSTWQNLQINSAQTVFGTSGAERMRIDSSGNVGIGTSSPSAPLDIQSNSGGTGIRVRGRASANAGAIRYFANDNTTQRARIESNDTSFEINSISSLPITILTADTERMRIDSSGNVGIGTSSPSTFGKVAILAPAGGTGLNIVAGSLGTTTTGLTIGSPSDGGNNGVKIVANTAYSTSGVTSMSFFTNNGSSFVEAMRIDYSGNVGIGTSSPGQKLDVAGDITFGSANKFTSSANVLNGASGQNGARIRSAVSSVENPTFSNVDDTNTGMFFPAADTIAFTEGGVESMRIDSSGALIIGATSLQASEKLSVYGSATGGGSGIAYFKNTASGTSGDGAPPAIITKTSTTTTSSARFMQFYANNLAQPMGGIVGNGAENVQFLTLSDEREKENIKPVTGALNKIMQLQVSSFNRKGSKEFVPSGFIAQNVLPVYPEYVVENAANDGKEQRYGITGGMSAGYIAELTAAIQELKSELDSVKAELQILKGK
jgi:hypothetical protein